MKIVLIADTHNYTPELPDGDMLIHAGDATLRGTKEEIEQFDTWLGTLKFKHILFTPGNHDFYFEKNRSILKNATMLINEGIVIGGVSFWASPYTPLFGSWTFMKLDNELADIWKYIPDKVDVLITHGPPYGILDLSVVGDQGINKHAGSPSLRKRVEIVEPKIHVFGHLHEGAGKKILGNTLFVNASVLNEYYQNVNKPIVVEI